MLKRNRINFILGTAIILGIFGVFLFSANFVLAQNDLGLSQLEPTLAIATQTDIRVIIARIIQAALGLVGVIMVGLIVYAGVLYMTSGGEAAKTATARKVITNAIIGLAIILSSLAITEFIVRSLTGQGFGGGGGGGGGGRAVDTLSGALGGGIIQDHYPGRDAKDIPRNVKIIVTFKEPIKLSSLIEDTDKDGTYGSAGDKLNLNNVKIRKSADNPQSGPFVSAGAAHSSDNRTFVFAPDGLLGSSKDNVKYTVALGPGIKKVNDENAFGANFAQGYGWEFTTGTFVDETPPKIETVIPGANGTYAKNVSIEVTFNEPVDPLTVSGDSSGGFNNLKVTREGGGGAALSGGFIVSNGYRTVNFISKNACGVNSCGETVFCQPGASKITANVRAATLGSSPPVAALPYPYDGVTDVVGNSLDGNSNSLAEGPSLDSYAWSFNTTDLVDLTAPKVLRITPESEAASFAVGGEVSLEFSKVMLGSSLNNGNLIFHGAKAGAAAYDSKLVPWWTVRMSYLDNLGAPTKDGSAAARSLVSAPHGNFLNDTFYYPEATSALKDLYQNCYFPPESLAPSAICAATPAKPYCCGSVSCGTPCKIDTTGRPYCQ